MSQSASRNLLKSLAEEVGRATSSCTTFAVAGDLPAIDPKLVVDTVGAVPFPLQQALARKLKTTGAVAPYGKGTRTFVDPTVRKTLEIDASRVQLGDDWNRAIAAATRSAAQRMGLPAAHVEPILYKLLIYERGGFFLPHRDSEKHDRMVASLIVVLPNSFEGGNLIVRHSGQTESFDFYPARRVVHATYAAFYADCEHEVKPVTNGLRVCLAYNLVLNPSAPKPVVPPPAADPLTGAMRDWVAAHPTEPLVFAFDHEYTTRGLARDLLKGADRARADLIVAAAERAECLVHLAQLSRHDCLSAYDGSEYGYNRGRRWNTATEYEIEDLIDREFFAETWAEMDGKPLPWGEMPLDPAAVVASRPFDEWIPDKEDYEGYTGNAGNTLDRWYARSGLVVWSRARHFEILPGAGLESALAELEKMVKALSKNPEPRRESARIDALGLACGILAKWPRRWVQDVDGVSQKSFGVFPKLILALDDRDLVEKFLATVAERDDALPLVKFAVEAGRRWGWPAFAKEWTAFFQPSIGSPRTGEDRLRPRDVEWLCAACEAGAAAEAPWVVEVCTLAAVRYGQKRRPEYRERGRRHAPTLDERVLPALLKAFLAAGLNGLADAAIAFAREHPDIVSRESGSVPALIELVPWCRSRFGALPAAVRDWLAAERAALVAATAARPAPPSDWKRPNEIRCTCVHCARMKSFLADPTCETIAIPAVESDRHHLVRQIESDELDAKSSVSKFGRPYSLVLTKTNLAHGRSVMRYEVDCKLLESLPADEDATGVTPMKPVRKRSRK